MVGKSDNDQNRARPDNRRRAPVPAAAARAAERVAKAIARAGLCSRREAEAWIAAGRVAVNGQTIASPAVNVGPGDRVTVDGEPLPQRERTRLFLYYKPVGLVTTHADPQGRPTIFAALPKYLPRLLSVGRLDINSEGLLLLTNDGGLARVLELPETGWLRRYRVRAHGRVTQADLDRLRAGITIDGIRYGPIEATLDRQQGSNVWLTVGIREGKNREVRNVLGALDLQVNRLIRVSFGPFQLGELREGEIEEVRTRHLREQIGDRIARLAGCDFTGPMVVRAVEEARAPAPEARERPKRAHGEGREHERPRTSRDRLGREQHRQKERRQHRGDERRPKHGDERRPHRREEERAAKPPGRPRRGHAWRAEDAPLRRHYRGERGAERQVQEEPAKPKRAGLLTDRKGRRVLVERFGAPESEPKPPQKRHAKRFGAARDGAPPRDERARPGKPPRRGRPDKSRDRARGPRPSRPREH
jgi:23S rRNA pseudouridine2605 synthase